MNLALDVHAAELEPSTPQVGAERAGDEGGKPFAAAWVESGGQEGLEMDFEGAIEGGVLWSVSRGTPEPDAAGLPGGRARRSQEG
jgi:hypothetical protein